MPSQPTWEDIKKALEVQETPTGYFVPYHFMENVRKVIASERADERREEKERIKTDLDNIWNQYHVNNDRDDGFRDSKDTVIEKFYSALKEQIDYFSPQDETT